jgi:hypothetical protein
MKLTTVADVLDNKVTAVAKYCIWPDSWGRIHSLVHSGFEVPQTTTALSLVPLPQTIIMIS